MVAADAAAATETPISTSDNISIEMWYKLVATLLYLVDIKSKPDKLYSKMTTIQYGHKQQHNEVRHEYIQNGDQAKNPVMGTPFCNGIVVAPTPTRFS